MPLEAKIIQTEYLINQAIITFGEELKTLEYVLKFHKLLQKVIHQFTELQKSLLLDAGIEIDL